MSLFSLDSRLSWGRVLDSSLCSMEAQASLSRLYIRLHDDARAFARERHKPLMDGGGARSLHLPLLITTIAVVSSLVSIFSPLVASSSLFSSLTHAHYQEQMSTHPRTSTRTRARAAAAGTVAGLLLRQRQRRQLLLLDKVAECNCNCNCSFYKAIAIAIAIAIALITV